MYPCHQAMWLIKPGKVLRKRLRDFSLGHAYLLEALESPFMVGGKVGLGDLAVAVLVCSKTFAKAREFLMLPPPSIVKHAERWGFWCRLLGVKLDREMEQFKEYYYESCHLCLELFCFFVGQSVKVVRELARCFAFLQV